MPCEDGLVKGSTPIGPLFSGEVGIDCNYEKVLVDFQGNGEHFGHVNLQILSLTVNNLIILFILRFCVKICVRRMGGAELASAGFFP